ncbi:hypothetical protein [Microbacterium sp. NIBRBAC000506063]|uniref:hypothetical protein n=1 Tax=Microbacterium sp. NIBRBAC000506063 TaxID=2734618 RepID=UPI001BB50481|nr:hypothetical protein [Microbacterium sp. NIBRBAC000506063]QTV79883.1 hypothetical protein KAE78_01275 [Microbacterium sp. NIBRBAC000506063]
MTNSGETTGLQGQTQQWQPTPTPGADFPIDGETLTLLDAAGDPTDEIVVDGVGRYEVVGEEIVFTRSRPSPERHRRSSTGSRMRPVSTRSVSTLRR